MDERSQPQRVTRTYRASIRLGEDFITLEENITLALDASDADLQAAVDLGWRIYQAQQESFEQQVAALRERMPASAPQPGRDPDAPASERQRDYVARLQRELGWSQADLAALATAQDIDLAAMTRGAASRLIDELKRQSESPPAPLPQPIPPEKANRLHRGAQAIQAFGEAAMARLERLAAHYELDAATLLDEARVQEVALTPAHVERLLAALRELYRQQGQGEPQSAPDEPPEQPA